MGSNNVDQAVARFRFDEHDAKFERFPKEALLDEGWTARALVEALVTELLKSVSGSGLFYIAPKPLLALGLIREESRYSTLSAWSDSSLQSRFSDFQKHATTAGDAVRERIESDQALLLMLGEALTAGVFLRRQIISSSHEAWVPQALTRWLDDQEREIARSWALVTDAKKAGKETEARIAREKVLNAANAKREKDDPYW